MKLSSSDRVVRIGIFGCGTVARRHVDRLLPDPRVHVVVCCDPRLEAAEDLAQRFTPAARPCATEDEAFAYPLDAVLLASPTQVHYRQACRALDQGLDVLCEKPLATCRQEVVDLIARRQRARRILSVAYQRRYESPYTTARRELTERRDDYGPIRTIHLYVCERWHQTIGGTWRDDPAVGAGYFGDAGSHQVDVMGYISGLRPVEVEAWSDKRGARVEIVTGVRAVLDSGASLMAHFVGDAHHWHEEIYFHGERADLLLRRERLLRGQQNRLELITNVVEESDPCRAFVDAILAGTETASPAECALPMIDWTAAVLRSARERRPVRLAEVANDP